MNDQEKIQWFERAVKFQLDGLIFLTMRERKSSGGVWVVEDVKNHKILNSNMEWEEDLPKDKRDESFMIRTRFDFETAMTMYDQYKMFAA